MLVPKILQVHQQWSHTAGNSVLLHTRFYIPIVVKFEEKQRSEINGVWLIELNVAVAKNNRFFK